MVIDTGIMTLDISIIEYIEKIVDSEQGYGVKIVFLPDLKKLNRFVYFGKIREYRLGQWSDQNNIDAPRRAYSIIYSDGSATAFTKALISNKIEDLNSYIYYDHEVKRFYDEFLNPMNLQTDLIKRDQFYDKIFKAMVGEE
jgi:hypothetical protein